MILASILAIYFVIIVCQQSNDLTRAHRIAQDGHIRRGLLSYTDIVTISQQRHAERHYLGARGVLLSCRLYLSANGRLYHYKVVNGHKAVEFCSYLDAISETANYQDSIIVWFRGSGEVPQLKTIYNVIFSFGSMTYSEI